MTKMIYLMQVTKKRLLFIVLLFFVLQQNVSAKYTPIYADPAVGSFDITTLGDVSVSANQLINTATYKLKLQVYNFDLANPVPWGGIQYKIGLGTKLQVAPGFSLTGIPESNYFDFTLYTGNNGQKFITAYLKADLPPNYIGEFSFNITALDNTQSGTSNITVNTEILYGNNPLYDLSDVNTANNSAGLQYSFAQHSTLPVTLTGFTASNKNCALNISWTTAQELNVERYEVEVSKDGNNFVKASTVPAQSRSSYGSNIAITDALKANNLYLRLKCIDIDGSFKYSNIIQVSGVCGAKSMPVVIGYPNPLVKGMSYINIGARDGVFSGQYDLLLSDISGKVYTQKTIILSNVTSFRFDVPQALSTGKYFIRMIQKESGEKSLVQFEKM